MTDYTITCRTKRPDHTLMEGTYTARLVSVMAKEAGVGLYGYRASEDTVAGVATLTLPPSAGLDPESDYVIAFESLEHDERGTPLLRYSTDQFTLNGNKTLDQLLDISDVPLTPSLVQQATDARDDALVALAEIEDIYDDILALGATNDAMVAGLMADEDTLTGDEARRPAQTLLKHVLTTEGDEPGAVVVFSPDDGYTQQVADIAVINARGYPASLNLTRGWVNLAGTNVTWGDTYITSAQVQAIVDHAVGNEITYHDNTDHKGQTTQLVALGAAGLTDYVQDFITWAKTTFDYDVKTGAYPAGASNERVREIMGRAGLEFMRGTKGKPGDYANDPFDTPGIDILTLTLAQVTAAIDIAIAKRSVVSLLWHGGGDDTFRDKLGDIIDYCEAHGVPIKTYHQAMSERTAWRGQSAATIDRQGNAFLKTTRTRRLELGRGDSIGDSIWIERDLVNNAAYMDGDNGRPFEFRNAGLRVLGARFESGRQLAYSATTTNGSPTITAITGFSADNSILGVGVTGPGIPPNTYVGDYTATTISMVAADLVTPVNAGVGAGTGTITLAFPANPTAKFFARTEFHNGARVVTDSAGTGWSIYDLAGNQTFLLNATGLKRLAAGTFNIDTSGGNLELEALRVKIQSDGGTAHISFAPTLPTDGSIADGETVIFPDPATGTLLYKGKSAGGVVFGPTTLGQRTRRVVATADTATLTVDVNTYDAAKVTALAQAMTIAAPTGTPAAMQSLIIRIKDNGTIRGLTWNSVFRAIGVTLPTSTAAGKTLYVGAVWNTDDTKWDVIAVAQQA